jgi:hypothetical protein
MDCRIDKHPLLILPRQLSQRYIDPLILKHELEINFEKDVDEVELIRMVNKIGGVLAMIKDEFHGPRKYVVALNSTARMAALKE